MAELVLIVDDEKANQHLLSTGLQNAGYEVITADNGLEAIDILQQYDVDTVLLDLVMPELDGYELLDRIKGCETLRHIPVIIISMMDDIDSTVQCIKLGAADFLPKPFNSILLKARIEASIASKHLHDLEKKYAIELEQQNQELDAFAHTVAHDLKNPLTTILGYSEMLSEDFDEISDEMKKDLLCHLVRNCHRMDSIIRELLLLAQIRNKAVTIAPLDMNLIVEEVKARLIILTSKQNPEFIIDRKWPAIWGYGPWVEEILANYISNAIKYGGSPPSVEVGAVVLSNNHVKFGFKTMVRVFLTKR